MPDPGLTDLIAAHQLVSTATIFHRNGMVQRPECKCGELMHWAGAYPAHVALVVEQHTNGRTTELEAELVRLRAQVASIGRVSPGTCSPRETWPDDSEINAAIEEAETFNEALFEIAEKYEVPVTNNMNRWQDGQFLRHSAEFTRDIRAAALKHLRAALEGEQQ